MAHPRTPPLAAGWPHLSVNRLCLHLSLAMQPKAPECAAESFPRKTLSSLATVQQSTQCSATRVHAAQADSGTKGPGWCFGSNNLSNLLWWCPWSRRRPVQTQNILRWMCYYNGGDTGMPPWCGHATSDLWLVTSEWPVRATSRPFNFCNRSHL